MEDVSEIFSEYSSWKFDFEKSASVIECDNEEGRSSGDRRGLRVELLEVLLSPLIDSIRVDSWFSLESVMFFFFLFLHS